MPHTPGPWEVHHWGDNEGDIHGSDGKVVCVMRDGATAQEEDWEGDARLIAAAPEMLAALKMWMELETTCDGRRPCYCDDPEVAQHGKCYACVADAAIAKAEGRG